MKRIIIVLIITLLATVSYAQTGIYRNRFYISGSLALGKENRDFADSSVWLQLGNDTTDKGLLMPRVLLDSIKTAKRGVFVYDLKDSVLYHFDSNKRVRYMTYKDTVLIKTLIYTYAKTDTTVIAAKTWVDARLQNYYSQNGNAFGTTAILGTTDNNGLNIKTNNTNRIIINATGEVGIGTTPTNGQLHVNGMIGTDGLRFINNGSNGGGSSIYKDPTYGIAFVGSNGSSADFMLVNNPTNGLTVFSVPHATNTASFFGQVQIHKTSSEVQLDMSGASSGHLYAGISAGTFDVTNRGFISFGDSYGASNSHLLFGTSKIAVGNANLLAGTYTDNGTDKLQVNGTMISTGMKLNNATTPNPANYNLFRRYNDGAVDGVEILAGGAAGGYIGGFKVKSDGLNATTTPKESFVIRNNVITMGHHGTDYLGNTYFNWIGSQVNIARDNPDGQLLNLWNRRTGYPVTITLGNDAWGAGGPMANSAIVGEVGLDGFKGLLSFFTNNGVGGDFANDMRAMLIDGYQNVGIGVSRSVAPTYLSTGLTLPSARLHVQGNLAGTPVSIFQSAASQTADITQWKDNAGTTLAKVDNAGNATVQALTTAQPSSNGAGTIKIGKVITGASVTLQTDKFLEIDVDGTIYKLAIVN